MMKYLRGFASSKVGATSIEYALVAIGIALAIIISIGMIGVSLDATYKNVSNEIAKGGG